MPVYLWKLDLLLFNRDGWDAATFAGAGWKGSQMWEVWGADVCTECSSHFSQYNTIVAEFGAVHIVEIKQTGG